MSKVSEIVRAQAAEQFKNKRPIVIENTLKKIAEDKGQSFERVLNTYMGEELVYF